MNYKIFIGVLIEEDVPPRQDGKGHCHVVAKKHWIKRQFKIVDENAFQLTVEGQTIRLSEEIASAINDWQDIPDSDKIQNRKKEKFPEKKSKPKGFYTGKEISVTDYKRLTGGE